jgi:hypothetical protein
MELSRRRILSVLAAAPFAPWKEILEEASKPRIFCSIPPRIDSCAGISIPFIYGDISSYRSPWLVRFMTEDEKRIHWTAYRFGIPPEMLEIRRGTSALKNNDHYLRHILGMPNGETYVRQQ